MSRATRAKTACGVEPRLHVNVSGLTTSATVAINERSNEMRRQGRDVFKLGLGQSPFPVPESVVEALRPARLSEGLSTGEGAAFSS